MFLYGVLFRKKLLSVTTSFSLLRGFHLHLLYLFYLIFFSMPLNNIPILLPLDSPPHYQSQAFFFFNFQIRKMRHLFIYCWPWVFIAVCGLSLVVVSRGYPSLGCAGFSRWWLLLLGNTASRHLGFSGCSSQAQ